MNVSNALATAAPSTIAANQPAVVPAADALYREQARIAAEKFESFFIAEMMKQMRRSARELAGEDGMFRDRVGADLLEMADTLVADALSGQRAFGVADAILRQLLPPLNEPATPVASHR